MRRLIAGLLGLLALAAAAPAQASTPTPWCGTGPVALDAAPDASLGFAVHVAYVHAPGTADRLGEWAPRIVGDVTAIDAWWRSQDSARTLRFDLLTGGCGTPLGALDITDVALSRDPGGIDQAFGAIRFLLATQQGFAEPEKAYLVYYDGPTGQPPDGDSVCGQGSAPSGLLSGIAIVFLDSCEAATSDSFRPVVAVHELVHVLGAVAAQAPGSCSNPDLRGHVCGSPADLMNASLTGMELEAHVLDSGRDDYYGHQGAWLDVQDSLFLERLDSPDRAAPSTPPAVTATNGPAPGIVRVSWTPSSDDVGPVSYRVYQDGRFLRQVSSTSALLNSSGGDTSSYSVRAADPVGHLSPAATIRFTLGLGLVDERGRLLRDTVPPPAVRHVSVRRIGKRLVLAWPAVRDRGGLRGYRIRVGSRTLTVRRPTVTIAANPRRGVTLVAIDRAGNVGTTTLVPARRLR